MRRAVFLDRDGTLIHDPGLPRRSRRRRTSSTRSATRCARSPTRASPSSSARTSPASRAGSYDDAAYRRVAARLDELLLAEGVHAARDLLLPLPPRGHGSPGYAIDHEDRKPAPGMWRRAAADHGIDLAALVLDRRRRARRRRGKRAGTTPSCSPPGETSGRCPSGGPYDPDFTARDLREAVLWILRREGRPLPDRPGAPLSSRRGRERRVEPARVPRRGRRGAPARGRGSARFLARFLHAAGTRVVAVAGTSMATAARPRRTRSRRGHRGRRPTTTSRRMIGAEALDALVVASPPTRRTSAVSASRWRPASTCCARSRSCRRTSARRVEGARFADAFAAKGLLPRGQRAVAARARRLHAALPRRDAAGGAVVRDGTLAPPPSAGEMLPRRPAAPAERSSITSSPRGCRACATSR